MKREMRRVERLTHIDLLLPNLDSHRISVDDEPSHSLSSYNVSISLGEDEEPRGDSCKERKENQKRDGRSAGEPRTNSEERTTNLRW